MKLYKKYLISNLFKPLILFFATLILIIWSSKVVNFMDYIVEDGADFFSFFKLTTLILPTLTLTILPLTIFLTTILTYNKFIENREIIILKNCGIKKSQLLSPLIFLAIFITIIGYFFSLYGIYKSNMMVRELRQEIQNNISFSMIKEGSFVKFKNIVIYADKKDKNNAYNVLIYNQAKNINEKNYILQANMAKIEGNIITLYNGNFQQFTFDKTKSPEILFFDKYFIDINDLIENKNIVINRLDSISTLKLFDVLKNYNDYKNIYPNKNKLFYEVNYRFGFPLISIIVALLTGALMLEATFNRVSNTKLLLKASIFGGGSYIILLSLFQKVADGIQFLYILYIFFVILLIISFRLIKEKKVI